MIKFLRSVDSKKKYVNFLIETFPIKELHNQYSTLQLMFDLVDEEIRSHFRTYISSNKDAKPHHRKTYDELDKLGQKCRDISSLIGLVSEAICAKLSKC